MGHPCARRFPYTILSLQFDLGQLPAGLVQTCLELGGADSAIEPLRILWRFVLFANLTRLLRHRTRIPTETDALVAFTTDFEPGSAWH